MVTLLLVGLTFLLIYLVLHSRKSTFPGPKRIPLLGLALYILGEGAYMTECMSACLSPSPCMHLSIQSRLQQPACSVPVLSTFSLNTAILQCPNVHPKSQHPLFHLSN